MNCLPYLLHSVADVDPMAGGRSQLYLEFTKGISSLSPLYVAFIFGSRSLGIGLDVRISSACSPSELSGFQLVARASFVVLLAVAYRHCSMLHL